jgi:hypothetical protein
MGYTHYYTVNSEATAEQYEAFLADAHEIIRTAEIYRGIALANGWGDKLGEWQADTDAVIFNGFNLESHETFSMTPNTVGFNFCKTAYKPYDAVVTACLIALKDAYGDDVEISSDGQWGDWQNGAELYRDALAKPAECPLSAYVS